MEFSLGHYKYVIPAIILVCIILEVIWSRLSQKKVYNTKDTLTNLAILAGYITSKVLLASYSLALLGVFYQFRLHTFGISTVTFFITFIGVDFCFYWYHYASHVIRFFWAFHFVHHSSQEMNLTVAYRINWFSALISPFFYIPLALIGLPPAFIVAAYGLNLLFQFFLHTEAIRKLGFLEYIFNTPSNHRVHHGSNDQYIDKNFGGVLIIWDRLFGTYQPEEEKPKYGVTTGFLSYNPIALIFKGFYDFITGRMNYKG